MTLRGRRLVFLGVVGLGLLQIGLVLSSVVLHGKPQPGAAQTQTVPVPAK